MTIYGYARVSTEDQSTAAQERAMRAAGADEIIHEVASGARDDRPELARLRKRVRSGDTIMVVRLDRIGRSTIFVLDLLDQLRRQGVFFRSLGDPIDTSSASGEFITSILAAFAQMERRLIAERTKAGLETARAKGRVGGNPALKNGDPEGMRKLHEGRRAAYIARLTENESQWIDLVLRHRPQMGWSQLARLIHKSTGLAWSADRLRRSAKTLVEEGMLPVIVLAPATRRQRRDRDALKREMGIRLELAALRTADPDASLNELARRATAQRIPTLRGGYRWSPSMVKNTLRVT